MRERGEICWKMVMAVWILWNRKTGVSRLCHLRTTNGFNNFSVP